MDVRLQPDGSIVLTHNILEKQLLPAVAPLPRDLRTVVRALLLTSTLSTEGSMGTAARILRRLGGVFDDAAALAQLGQQLEAAQQRRGGAAPRLPTAQQLQQLWLWLCVRAGSRTPAGEGWPGVEDWAVEAARRLTRLDAANPRAWLVWANLLGKALAPQEAAAAAAGTLPRAVKQRQQEVTSAFRRGLAAARAAGNRYLTALAAYSLVVQGARLMRGCTPSEAAVLLREAEAAWAAVKKAIPEEWARDMQRERAAARAFEPVLQAHERESPEVFS